MDSSIIDKDTQNDAFKIFLIVSNQEYLNDKIEYYLESSNKIINLDKLYTKILKNNEGDFTVSIYSSNIDKLNKNNFDAQSKKYKDIVILKYNNNTFKGIIFYKEKDRNNFIYDLKFKENDQKISPPIYLNFTKLEQLKLFSELLKNLKVKQGERLSKDLLIDSQLIIRGSNSSYYFDFYLEIFKQSYSQKEIKTLLMMFKLDRVILPKEMKVKEYSSILKMIEKKPSIIIKYIGENDNIEKYYKYLYTLLLFFYSKYDSKEASFLLSKKELWKYYVEIIPMNHKYFFNIELSEELINEIFILKNLSYQIIKGTLSYIDSFEKLLIIINKNIAIIFECLKKQGEKLILSEFINPKEKDNIKIIGSEIEKILKYQSERKEEFIIFEKDFLIKYIKIDDEKKEINEVEDKDAPLPIINKNEINYEENNKIIEKMKDNNNEYKNEAIKWKEDENIDIIIHKEKNVINEKERKEDEKIEKIQINNVNEYNEVIEKRLLMPIIGNSLAHKSYFLNLLFGIEFCQIKSQKNAKLILFIRHINNLNQPKLYQLFPVKTKNSTYDFKKGNIILGEKQIMDKIIEIYNLYIDDKEPLFYMLEIEIKSIKNKEFLNKFYFVDIPGLNESEIDNTNLYFKYIKNMIKYCLIIFSEENYNSKESREIINIIKKNILVPFENFLLILNKIDKVNDKAKDSITNFKKILLNYYNFHCYDNTLISVNSLQMNNEFKIESNFYDYLNYYFNEHINDNNKTKTNNDFGFLNFIKNKIDNIYSDPKKKDLLNLEIENLNIDSLKSIKKDLISFIEEKKAKGYNLMIDLEEIGAFNYFKKFYICFKEKIIFPENFNTLREINKYFDEIKDYSLPGEEETIKISEEKFIYNNSEEHKLLKKLDEFFKTFFDSSKLKKYGAIIDLLDNHYKLMKNYILNSSLLFISILGVSNSGKSSFINCLLKKDLLTCNSPECTKRGIIIRYIEDKSKVSLYTIKFKKDMNESFNQYYYTKEKLLSNKIENIIEIIKILNENYPPKEEDFCLLLEINIPIFDDLKMEPEIKNNICLIDFPGYDMNNNLLFENEVYQNILKMSTIFIYMNNVKDINTNLLSKLFKEVISINIGDLSSKEFIDSFLFVFNKADALKKEEVNLNIFQNQIEKALILPYNNIKNLCSFFSSKIYKTIFEESYKYKIENFNSLLEKYYKIFKQSNYENFLKYVFKELYKMIKNEIIDFSFNEKDKINSFDIFIKISEKVEKFYSEKDLKKDINYENNLLKISKLLTYYSYYKETYTTKTFNIIHEKINKASTFKRNEVSKHLKNCFYFLNILFKIENTFANVIIKDDFNFVSKNIKSNIKNIFQQFKYEQIINQHKIFMLGVLNYRQELLKRSFGKSTFETLQSIIKDLNAQIIQIIGELNHILEENLKNIRKVILIQLEKIWLPEKKTNSNLDLSLEFKELGSVIAIPSSFIIFPSSLAYSVIWKLPSSFLKLDIIIGQRETKFYEYIQNMKEEVNNMMKNYLVYYIVEIIKFENFINEVIQIFLGLIESNYIKEDDNHNEAKNNYLKIYEDYKKLKI